MIPRQIRTLGLAYRSWHYWLLTASAGVIYYFILQYLIEISNKGIVIITVPKYLLFLLDITAAISITLGVYSVRQSLIRTRALSGASSGVVSSLSVLTAGVSVSCACQAPILYNILYFVGLNSFEASGIVVTINDLQVPIMWGLVALNLIVILIITTRTGPISNKK
jgi:hypothetical protein